MYISSHVSSHSASSVLTVTQSLSLTHFLCIHGFDLASLPANCIQFWALQTHSNVRTSASKAEAEYAWELTHAMTWPLVISRYIEPALVLGEHGEPHDPELNPQCNIIRSSIPSATFNPQCSMIYSSIPDTTCCGCTCTSCVVANKVALRCMLILVLVQQRSLALYADTGTSVAKESWRAHMGRDSVSILDYEALLLLYKGCVM